MKEILKLTLTNRPQTPYAKGGDIFMSAEPGNGEGQPVAPKPEDMARETSKEGSASEAPPFERSPKAEASKSSGQPESSDIFADVKAPFVKDLKGKYLEELTEAEAKRFIESEVEHIDNPQERKEATEQKLRRFMERRQNLITYKNLINTKKAIEKSFKYQVEGKGFSLVEILSPCPVDWRLSPKDSITWIQKEMISVYPLGTFKDTFKETG